MKLSTILGLIREDTRRLVIPLGLFSLCLAVAGLLRVWFPEEATDTADLGLWFFGLLAAGLFGQAHPIHPRAYWRTRPWSASTVLVAKLIEVFGLVWLPMAALQLALLTTFDLPGKPWAVWLGELFLALGGPLLIATTVGALTRSVRMLVLIGWAVAFVVAIGPLDVAISRAVLTAGALVTLTVAYVGRDRLRAALLGTVFLVVCAVRIVWPEPPVTDPAFSVEVTSAQVPDSNIGYFRGGDSVRLCVEVALSSRPAEGWIELTPRATFRGNGRRLDLGQFDLWTPMTQRVERDETVVALVFSELLSRVDPHRGGSGSLDLVLTLESKTVRVLGAGPLEVGTTVIPARYLASRLDIVEVDVGGDEIDVRMDAVGLRHLTGPRPERTRLRLDPTTPYQFTEDFTGWRHSGAYLDLPFYAQQRAYFGGELSIRFFRADWAADHPRYRDEFLVGPVDEIVSTLRWQRVEHVVRDRRIVRMTLEDIKIADLACGEPYGPR